MASRTRYNQSVDVDVLPTAMTYETHSGKAAVYGTVIGSQTTNTSMYLSYLVHDSMPTKDGRLPVSPTVTGSNLTSFLLFHVTLALYRRL